MTKHYIEEPIIKVIKEHETGLKAENIWHRPGISAVLFTTGKVNIATLKSMKLSVYVNLNQKIPS